MGKTVQEKVKEHQALTDEQVKSQKLLEALENLIACVEKDQIKIFPHNLIMSKQRVKEYKEQE